MSLLDLAGLPFRSQERAQESPLIIGGGSCGMNPEPVADFFDAIVLGDGEEVIVDIADTIRRAKKTGLERKEVLGELAEIEGVYVPSFFAPHYAGTELAAMEPLRPGGKPVRRRVLPRLPVPEERGKPLVPISGRSMIGWASRSPAAAPGGVVSARPGSFTARFANAPLMTS